MTSPTSPAAGPHPQPKGARDLGDAWVEGGSGRFWGRFGAAGLLVHDVDRGVLLQHRALWSDHGGTWGLPGGALHLDEDPVAGALREAHEEAAVPAAALHILATSVLDLGYWQYTTVVARVCEPFEPVVSDPESIELRWVPVDDVPGLPLHPALAKAWPVLAKWIQ